MHRTSPTTTQRGGRISPATGGGGGGNRTRSPVVGSFTPNMQHPRAGAGAGGNSTTSSAQQTPRNQQQYVAGNSALRIKNMHNNGGGQQPQSQQYGHSHSHHSQLPPPSGGGRSPRPGSTPNSARSASVITDLEGVINEVMRDRMHSLAESRKRVEELADMHKHETEVFLKSMEQVLAQSAMATGAQRDMQEDYEDMLDRERGEKGKMLHILQRFKQEGDRVTGDLKKALTDEREKHREQLYRNEHLMHKVREYADKVKQQQAQMQLMKEQMGAMQHQLRHQQQQPSSSSSQQFASGGGEEQQQQQVVPQLVELLKDHERVIDELERRNRNLEHDLRYQQSKARLSMGSTASGGGGGSGSAVGSLDIPDSFDNAPQNQQLELNSLIQQFAAAGGGGNAMPAETMNQLVRGLLHQLRNENRMRLRVEEQSTKLVSDQDEQIRKLESKLRELQMSGGGAGSSSTSGGVVLGSPSPARPLAAQQRRPVSPVTQAQQQQQQSSFGAGGDVQTTVIGGSSSSANNAANRRAPGAMPPVAASGSASNAPRLPHLSGVGGSANNSGTSTPVTQQLPPMAPPQNNNDNAIAVPPSQPKRQATIGLEGDDHDSSDDDNLPPPPRPQKTTTGGDDEFEPADRRRQQPQQQRESSVATSKAPSVSVSEMPGPSLEDQLAEVTNSFNEGVQTWQQAAGEDDGATSRGAVVDNPDEEFEPEH